MPQPDHISVLPVPNPEALDGDLQELFALCMEKLGIVPNVLRAYSPRAQKLRNFVVYNELMLAPSASLRSSERWSRSSCRAPTVAITALLRTVRRCGAWLSEEIFLTTNPKSSCSQDGLGRKSARYFR